MRLSSRLQIQTCIVTLTCIWTAWTLITSRRWVCDIPRVVQERQNFTFYCKHNGSQQIYIAATQHIVKERVTLYSVIGGWASWGKFPANWTADTLRALGMTGRVTSFAIPYNLVVSLYHAKCGDANLYRCASVTVKTNGSKREETVMYTYRDVDVRLANKTRCTSDQVYKTVITDPPRLTTIKAVEFGGPVSMSLRVTCVTPIAAVLYSDHIYRESVTNRTGRTLISHWEADGEIISPVNELTLIISGIGWRCQQDVRYACAVKFRLRKSEATQIKEASTEKCSVNSGVNSGVGLGSGEGHGGGENSDGWLPQRRKAGKRGKGGGNSVSPNWHLLTQSLLLILSNHIAIGL